VRESRSRLQYRRRLSEGSVRYDFEDRPRIHSVLPSVRAFIKHLAAEFPKVVTV